MGLRVLDDRMKVQVSSHAPISAGRWWSEVLRSSHRRDRGEYVQAADSGVGEVRNK